MMKYKFSALILGLTFAGVSQAGVLTFNYTLATNVFTGAFPTGDTLGAPAFTNNNPVTLTTGAAPTTLTLYTVLFTPAGTTNASSGISATDTLTITSPTSTPTALTFITESFLDTVAGAGGGRTHTLSGTAGPAQTFIFTATGYRLTVTPLAFTTIAPTTSGTGTTVAVQAQFSLAAPEPGTWMLLGSSLIGLGLMARRRKTLA